ncbi:transglycosylase SLT domain-containing protein [Legionella bononiensis]|uniref:Transglycosylase SLT domain-containing protein n=1 Tax=Legionella bononiensis TaxID=2793102 RepID=A0ABS1W782_9GAMM|nr:transglycosylase SLT domain-containing protein [Legionella bononiensis]MBL7481322.1 transglycosylase SLT domain-containing protein [Legionella bononiensis]MBL7525226.1 transglycosylase SLT domain-containing protein [Legionella bononiensis]MBL7561409.1 transglycosylase SLT domain-containing protein [Legionella bononiensis]
MTQIFTGEGLGLQGSSLGLGSYGPKGVAALGQSGESVYVNAANGNLVLRQSDGFLADIGFGLDLFQTYNSMGESGSNWRFNMQSRLELSGEPNTSGSTVTRIAEDGHRSRFIFDASKQSYVPEEGGTARLTYSQNGWMYREGAQKTVCYYSQEGQLSEIRDLDGHSVSFTYDHGQLINITDKSGKQTIRWLFQNGLVREVKTISDGVIVHDVHFEYDDQQRLHKVSRDLGQGKIFWITYNYAGDSNRISDIKQSDGTALHIEYDAQGRVKKLVDGEGRVTLYDYQSGKTTVTNGLGESWTYYYDEHNRLTGIDGPEQYRIRYYYEGALLSSIVQGNQVWRFRYNNEGDCIWAEEPSGQVTQRVYDSAHHVISETKYQRFDGTHHPTKPQTTRYIYDERGHLRFTIAADGTVTERRYDEEGQLVSTRCYLRAGYDLDSMGQDELPGLKELESWVTRQNPQDVSLIDYRYDWRGQLIEEVHYAQVDSQGHGINSGALSTRCRYDAAGRLVEKSTPINGEWCITQYLYDDLGRLIQTMDNQNHSQRFEYDDAHQRVIQTDANGLQTIRLYDRSGLLLSVMRLDSGHAYGSTTYKYDAAGRLIAETGVDGLTTYTFYDHQGRVQAQVSSSGQITETLYNDEGLIVKTRQYEQRVSTYGWLEQIPTFESIKPKNSLNDRIAQIVYNQYNQIAYRIDSQGAVIGYEYNAMGQVVATTAFAKRLSPFYPDQLLTWDNIHLASDGADRKVYYYYDALGQLEAKLDGEGYATAYHYDRLGHLIETVRYANPISTRLCGDWLQDKPNNSIKDIHTYSLYDTRGLKVADIDGEGYLTEYRYDSSGLLVEKCAYEKAIDLSVLINDTTTLDQLRPRAQNNDHHTTYQYNDLGLLTQEKSHTGLITTYVYDEMGQLVVKTLTDEQTHLARQQRYRYDALGRVIQSLNEVGCALLEKGYPSQEQIELIWQKHSSYFEYDNSGLLLSKTNALKQTTCYFYNEGRELKYTVNADGAVMETGYNSFGQVAFTRAYSAYLKINPMGLSTDELSHHVQLLQDDRYDEFTRYEYNTIGQVIAQYSGKRGLVTTLYNAFGEIEFTSQRISANRAIDTVFEYDKRGLLTRRIDDFGGLSRSSELRYDAFGWVSRKIDGKLNQISFVLNKRGEHVRIFNASNQLKKISYDAFGRVLTETDYTSSKTIKIFSYDDKNKTISLSNPNENTLVMTQFNSFGDKVSIKDANGYTTDFHYDEQGQLVRVDSPEGTFKEYRYDEAGHLIWQHDASGQIIDYRYDASGHLLSKTVDPNHLKITTLYQYDALGRQLQITDANGGIKQFVYDDQGNLIRTCVDPDGLNLVTEFSYDDRGLLQRQTEINTHGANKCIAYEWDNLGRRTATISDPDGLKLITTYQYDANDNLVCQIDANHHSTHYIYDALNRCRYQIDARGVVTEHIYDINGNEIETVTYAQSIPQLSHYDEASLKSILKEDAQHDHYQFRLFNTNGQVLAAYDGLGYVTTYDYDGNGNLIHTRQYASAVSLDELKNGNSPESPKDVGRETHYVYDGLNQLRFTCTNDGYVTESRYDKNGQLVSNTKYFERLSLGANGHYTLDNVIQKLEPNPQRDQTTRYTYDNAGRLTAELSAEGIAKSYQYDNLGQVISSTVHATRTKFINGELNLITSANDRTNHFVYDAAGREVYRISSEGRVLERRYDGVGNVIAELTHSIPVHLAQYNENAIKNVLTQDKQAKVTGYEYDAIGRLLTQVNAEHGVIHYTYDAQGNVLSKTEANQAVWTYQYDEANQLIETRSPSIKVTTARSQEWRSIVTRNSYDSFGNLIAVIRDAEGQKQTVLYEYDTNNHKIKTLYPDVKVNGSTAQASNQRQEITQTLFEEIQYNAFGEVIASSDKAGNWKHYAYDNQGLLVYSLDTQGGLTYYQYNSLGQVISKTLYANRLEVSKNFDYTIGNISNALSTSRYDRHEFYVYNLDNQVIEVSRDPVLMYNPKTGRYDKTISPTTKTLYNAFGEVIQSSVRINESEWAETYTYYDNEGHPTAVIDPEGYVTTYQYTVFGDLETMTEYALAARAWDTEHFTPGQTSSKDRTVTYTYDALGQLTAKTLKQVRYERLKSGTNSYETFTGDLTTTYSYDALGHLTSTTDAKGNTAYCYYDELGQLIAKVAPKTQEGRAATTYSYDALGHLVETRRWAQGAIEADETHFLLKGASTLDVVTRQEYDNQGQLVVQTDGINHQVNYSYDANGNLARSWQTLKQADGSILIQDKRYTYDSEKHLLQTSTFKNSGDLHTEDLQYNTFGEMVAKGNNGQYKTHYDYDNLGRVWRSNSQGYYQIFVYDLTDNVTQVVTSSNIFSAEKNRHGLDLSDEAFEREVSFDQDRFQYELQRQSNIYDKSGRLIGQRKEYGVNTSAQGKEVYLQNASQSQTVDRWGNMLTYTNALGQITCYEYNAFNQVIKQELPEVKVVDEHGVGRLLKPINLYAYDELGLAIAMVDANGHAVSKEYDALGRVITERDAKGNKRTRQYNLLEQLTNLTNELGGVTSYTYDQANRLVAVNTPKTHQQYEYDEAGELIKQVNGEKETSSFWYDAVGNQIKRRDARGLETSYEYDDAGHKTKETDANGRSQSWVYDEQGRLKQHVDLGGHVTSYDYNTNGLLLEETSTTGKHIKYHYQGDGALIQYVDEALKETVTYTYDAEGQMTSKESARGDTLDDGWIRETDHYQYDALGRLVQVRRRNPQDTDKRFPDKDHALLSIDYEYDGVGNIRHTQVRANYTKYDAVQSDDYYLFDENNRMTVNKGQLVNGQIMMTSTQGSTSTYDAAGNIQTASKYEHGELQNYLYVYNNDNQLELIQKNNVNLQSRFYDEAGRVIQENSFDAKGNLSQKNIMSYDKGLLKAQSTLNSSGIEVSKTTFEHDNVGNLTELKTRTNSQGSTLGSTLTHQYSYELWDNYQQILDKATQVVDQGGVSTGKSTKAYDINGQLKESIDEQSSNKTYYLNSGVEGIKGRKDKDGQTSYLTVAGKTIGDLRVDNSGKQHLTVYGGFTPSGSQQKAAETTTKSTWQRGAGMRTTSNFLDRTPGENADGILPEAPQDNLGAYTVQTGDTLERIAMQVYGDSSLWYVLADANGITDKNAIAGSSSQLHVGQRLNIPPVSTGQQHTDGTHKVLNAYEVLGNTSATTKSPMIRSAPPPLPKRHNGLFSKIVVGIIAVVATVMTAGIVGALAGAAISGGGGLFSLGMGILGGTATASLGATLAAGFTAGFVGSIASQGVAKTLGMQEGINFKGALISGLATAATGGFLRGLNGSQAYKDFVTASDNLSVSKNFSISSAAQMMEQNTLSQGISLALQKHQHFDWEQLGAAGITGGLMGSTTGKNITNKLNKLDKGTGIITSEAKSVVHGGAEAVAKGEHFNAVDVVTDNLGSAAGDALVGLAGSRELPEPQKSELTDELYLTDNVLDMIHPERTAKLVLQNYLATVMSGSGGYESSSDLLGTKQAQYLGNYQSLSFDSDLFQLGNSESDKNNFENKVYWSAKEHGKKGFVGDSKVGFDAMGLNIIDPILSLSAEEIWNIRAFQGEPIPNKKAGRVDAIERFVGFDRKEWNNLSEKQMSANLDNLQQHVLTAHKNYPNVPIEFINAVIFHESKGAWNAISPTGALGVMQLTADNYYKGQNANFNPFNVGKSINYGVGMLSGYLKKFGSTQDGINKSLAAYNQGLGHVSKAINEHGTNWVNHINKDGKSYIESIELIRTNRKKIPGYFGEKR